MRADVPRQSRSTDPRAEAPRSADALDLLEAPTVPGGEAPTGGALTPVSVAPVPPPALEHEATAHLDALWAAPLPLAIASRDGRIQRANAAFCEAAGSAAVGRHFGAALRPVDGRADQALQAAMTTGEPALFTVVADEPAAHGTFRASLTPIRRRGVTVAFSVALLAPHPTFQAEVLRQLPAALLVRNADDEIVLANERLRKLVGWEALAPPMRHLDGALMADEDLPVSRALRGEIIHGEEVLVERADGKELLLRVHATPVRDGAGAIFAAAGVIEDVTVRRRLEEERNKLLTLLESASDLISVSSVDGRTLYLNEAGRRLLGLASAEEALHHPLRDYLHESDQQRAVGELLPSVIAGNRFRGEVALRHFGTGEAVQVEAIAFTIPDRAGKPTAIAAVARDVREQKRAEAERQRLLDELAAKQRMLDAVLQQMPAGVIVAGAPTGALLFSNEQAEQILRRALYPVEAGAPARLSLALRDDGTPADHESWPLHRALRKGEVVTSEEVEVIRGDGTRAMLRCNAAPLRDGRGDIFAAIAVFDDVTEAKRAERALMESEARFRRLAESGMIGVLFAEGDVVTEANEAFLSLIGRTREELLAGRILWTEVASSGKDQLHRDRVARAEIRERGFCKPFERDFLRPDGKAVPTVVGAAQLEEGRKAWVLFVLDDRERKRAEELQRQLMGIVSHDLRSPLSAVVLASSLLLYAEDLPERHVKTAARIHTSAEKMRRLIGDLLDYQQARVGRGIPIHKKPADLAAVCADVVHELELVHAGRELRYSPNHDGAGLFDADRVSQVLQNLLTNAIDHSAPGTPVRLSWASEGRWLRIDVHNEGPPIAPELLPHLFEPFRRGKPRKGAVSGFGLGLFIVHEVVRAHGGEITVQSSPAAGTTFTVRLPR